MCKKLAKIEVLQYVSIQVYPSRASISTLNWETDSSHEKPQLRFFTVNIRDGKIVKVAYFAPDNVF